MLKEKGESNAALDAVTTYPQEVLPKKRKSSLSGIVKGEGVPFPKNSLAGRIKSSLGEKRGGNPFQKESKGERIQPSTKGEKTHVKRPRKKKKKKKGKFPPIRGKRRGSTCPLPHWRGERKGGEIKYGKRKVQGEKKKSRRKKKGKKRNLVAAKSTEKRVPLFLAGEKKKKEGVS